MEHEQHIIEIVTELLRLLGVTSEGVTKDVDEKTGSLRFVIATPDSALLIGEHGTRLSSLNHIVKKMVEHKYKDTELNFMIDVNDYQKKHVEELRSKAHIFAERARYFKSSVEMEPMSAYERMIIHAEFTNIPDIETSSTGYGKDRKITLKYTESKTPQAPVGDVSSRVIE